MNLKQLGLTEYEEKAYSTLIKLGKESASNISRESGVSYGKIYEVLASLEKKGLVKTIPEKTKKFIANNPENLMSLIKQQENNLTQLKKTVTQMKQIYETREDEVISIVKGEKNFFKLLKEYDHAKKFSYSIKWNSKITPNSIKKNKKYLEQNTDVKSLTRYDEETEKNVKKWLKIHKNIRKINNNGVAISISDQGVLINLIKNNTTLLVKDNNFTNIMKILFLETYKHSEKIN